MPGGLGCRFGAEEERRNGNILGERWAEDDEVLLLGPRRSSHGHTLHSLFPPKKLTLNAWERVSMGRRFHFLSL